MDKEEAEKSDCFISSKKYLSQNQKKVLEDDEHVDSPKSEAEQIDDQSLPSKCSFQKGQPNALAILSESNSATFKFKDESAEVSDEGDDEHSGEKDDEDSSDKLSLVNSLEEDSQVSDEIESD